MTIVNQIVPNGQQPYANQMNFGQLLGRVNGYNPECSPSVVANLINNVVRRVYDRRSGRWYGLMTKGQIVTPGFYSTGIVSVILGSTMVTGTGTSFTPAMVGQQFRMNYTAPIYNIVAFIDATHLQLELPWGNPTQSSSGYYITSYYYSFPNVRVLYSVKNLQMYFRMATGVPQNLLENWDPSRLLMMFPYVVASMPPDASGNFQVELWPVPNVQQVYPYLAYIQPPNLVDDLDNLPAFIRGDIIELGAVAEVLLYKPKNNPAYSESMAMEMSKRFSGMFEAELQHAAAIDEGLFRNDILTREESMPFVNLDYGTGAYLGVGGGGFLAAMSPVSAYNDWDY